MQPGEVFVHRNIANVVVHADLNCLSVMQFAVDVLKVEHIIVCGHYGCGGVHAVLHDTRVGLADNWLRHVGDVAQKHSERLAQSSSDEHRHTLLCALNAIEQAVNVCQRSAEHTSELQSLMRNSYDVFCLKIKKQNNSTHYTNNIIHLRMTLIVHS